MSASVLKDFAGNVEINEKTGCFDWKGKMGDRYGRFWCFGKDHLAHRMAWMIRHRKALTKRDRIFHTCGNLACVNPDHLSKQEPKVKRY